MKSLLKSLVALATCHWLTMVGVAIATGSAVVFISASLLPSDNPYLGILLFLVLPAFFLLGLVLIPIGLRQRSREAGGYRAVISMFEWQAGSVMRLLLVLSAATAINVVLLASAAWQGVQYMDSAAFCGTVCHVMEPQYVAYLESPHASVDCTSCHVGRQASSFLYHKVDGLRQVFKLVTRSYQTPIPPSGGRIHPASETCANCHNFDAWSGDEEKLQVIRKYASDEGSSPRFTALVLPLRRIHEAHAPGRIEYLAEDETLGVIPWFQAGGREYVAGARPAGESRSMDCIDCHNRTGHDFGSAAEAVDRAISRGDLNRTTPFARRDAIRALEGELDLSGVPAAVADIESAHVFPAMEVSWETYPINIGHTRAPGCFRCHDAAHESASGPLSQSCTVCHTLLALDQEQPEILDRLGIAY